MNTSLETERLLLSPLSFDNAEFIYELLNTPGWIEFIGDRNIKSIEDAQKYILKILDDSNLTYWVVNLKESLTTIGIVTFIKRNYLEHCDIGFAFLPQYEKNGYAFEATAAVLKELNKNSSYSNILATTIPENKNSIRLLEKLGLKYQKEITVEKEKLLIYSMG